MREPHKMVKVGEHEIAEDYTLPFGLWKVTTEDDDEGRRMRTLGVYKGYIDEIALHLARDALYKLTFKKVKPTTSDDYVPTSKSVSITLDIDSGTWDLSNNQTAELMAVVLKDRPCRVEEGNYFASFRIISDSETDQERKARLLKSATAKLSDEELEALGLKRV